MAKKYPDMKDEQLDKLFRDAAGRYTPPAAPEGAWEEFQEKMKSDELLENLEQKATDGTRWMVPAWLREARPWKIAVACLLILCLGGSLLWLSLKGDNQKNRGSVPAVNTAKIKKQNSVEGAVGNEKWQPSPVPPVLSTATDITSLTTGRKGNRAPQEATVMSAKANIHQQVIEYARSPLLLMGRLDGQLGITLKKDAASTIKDTGSYSQDYYAGGIKGPINGRNSAMTGRDSVNNNGLKPLKKAAFLAVDPIPSLSEQRQLHDFRPDAELAMNDSRDDNGSGRWQLGLIVGPNLTTVNGTVSKTAGLNTGVAVQRRINDSKFSVGSGVVLETLAYDINPGDFRPGGKTIQSTTLTGIEGKCQMIDVPINVRYDVVRSKKNSAFVSTGVSGLWMAKESYAYYYDKAGQSSEKNINVTGKGKSLYSVTNLSVGYERTFKKTSIQIEPYIKLPMSSIGYGNLNLGSLGTQISIKHNF